MVGESLMAKETQPGELQLLQCTLVAVDSRLCRLAEILTKNGRVAKAHTRSRNRALPAFPETL